MIAAINTAIRIGSSGWIAIPKTVAAAGGCSVLVTAIIRITAPTKIARVV